MSSQPGFSPDMLGTETAYGLPLATSSKKTLQHEAEFITDSLSSIQTKPLERDMPPPFTWLTSLICGF